MKQFNLEKEAKI